MLSNTEFARINHVDRELPADFEAFAMFTIDLGAATDENGKLLNPHLEGKGEHLWDVTPRREGMTQAEFRKVEAEQAKLDHEAKMALFIARGYAFDERAITDPSGGEDEADEDEAPQDEWEKFFAEDVKPRRSGGRHNISRVRGTAGFENFVDAAQ